VIATATASKAPGKPARATERGESSPGDFAAPLSEGGRRPFAAAEPACETSRRIVKSAPIIRGWSARYVVSESLSDIASVATRRFYKKISEFFL